jgi:hypothetical protein
MEEPEFLKTKKIKLVKGNKNINRLKSFISPEIENAEKIITTNKWTNVREKFKVGLLILN